MEDDGGVSASEVASGFKVAVPAVSSGPARQAQNLAVSRGELGANAVALRGGAAAQLADADASNDCVLTKQLANVAIVEPSLRGVELRHQDTLHPLVHFPCSADVPEGFLDLQAARWKQGRGKAGRGAFVCSRRLTCVMESGNSSSSNASAVPAPIWKMRLKGNGAT